ncbi:protein DMP3-like [Miscanthus floridulus]|uniref:protein DMP3-like n=1 Tax=Miscanthus floridulus TaxID=154761 RepID=UPI003457A484
MAVLSSFVFMIFPTKRRGIGFNNTDYSSAAGSDKASSSSSSQSSDKDDESSSGQIQLSANLLLLLPAGTVLAFQALAAIFTNQGSCHPSNWWLALGLVTFLTATCIFFALTDSITDAKGNVYHGVALPGRLYIFNATRQERAETAGGIKKRRLKAVDWVHGLFMAVAFVTIAGSDVGLQNWFFPRADEDTKQLLKKLPLGMAILSSFIFMIFPPSRKGIGFDNSDYNIIEGGGDGDGEAQRSRSILPETWKPSS